MRDEPGGVGETTSGGLDGTAAGSAANDAGSAPGSAGAAAPRMEGSDAGRTLIMNQPGAADPFPVGSYGRPAGGGQDGGYVDGGRYGRGDWAASSAAGDAAFGSGAWASAGSGDPAGSGGEGAWAGPTGDSGSSEGYRGYGDAGSSGGYGGYSDGGSSGGYGSYGAPGASGDGGRPPRRRWRGRLALVGGVAVLAAGLGGAAVALNTGNSSGTGVSSNSVPKPRNNTVRSTTTHLNDQKVASEVEPGMVDITSNLSYQSATAQGTGMVINSDGLVLTNNHVIDGATKITATEVTSGKKYTAKVLGYDTTQDVALLQLEGASGLKTINVGNSSQAKLGMSVLAIGNAEGQGGAPTVAGGIIDATNRTITASDEGSNLHETLHGMLQTNAEIVPGDSGGPLADATGQVLGMDTAASSGSSGSSTVFGYAIPINRALSIAKQIAAGKGNSSVHIGLPGFIGVTVTNASSTEGCGGSSSGGGGPFGGGFGSSSANGSGAAVNSGALICQVLSSSPAASSGLSAGDVITGVDGTSVSTAQALTTDTAKYQPGQKVSLTYVTPNDNKGTASVTLAVGPPR